MELIDKSTLTSEIERRITNIKGYCLREGHDTRFDVVPEQLSQILSFLDTLEVKEIGVDLGDPKGDKSAKYIIDTKTLEVKEDTISSEPLISSELLTASADYAREQLANPDYPTYNDEYELLCAFEAGANWQKEQIVLNDNNKEYHRVPSTTLKRLYMNEAKYESLKSDIMEGIVGDFEKGTTHNYLTIKIPMLLCPSNCTKGDKVKLIIIKEE